MKAWSEGCPDCGSPERPVNLFLALIGVKRQYRCGTLFVSTRRGVEKLQSSWCEMLASPKSSIGQIGVLQYERGGL